MTRADRSTGVSFAGVHIEYGRGVLAPRAWTAMQANWAVALLRSLPPGPVLELCCGVGHIGLVVARDSGRRVVQVDASPLACRYAARNARSNGLSDGIRVRARPLHRAVLPHERFPIVIADPPYVPSAEVPAFPQDPPGAIDGGRDGLGPARRCLAVAASHLVPDGVLLLQLRDTAQADTLASSAGRLELIEVRPSDHDGVVGAFGSPG